VSAEEPGSPVAIVTSPEHGAQGHRIAGQILRSYIVRRTSPRRAIFYRGRMSDCKT